MPSADVLNSDVNCGLQMNSDSTGVSSNENEMDIHKKRDSEGGQENQERKRRKKSRWAQDESDKTYIPGLPTVIPTNLSKEQEEAYVLQLQIEEVSRKLRTGDLGIPANPEERSPSPEPIYSFDGKRMNTREYRTRKRLEEERHQLIGRMIKINPEFKPPADYKPPLTRVSDKVMIPQDIHPDINFVGLLIGPRGNTLKAMEHETGAKIIIRGKGSVKEGKVGRKDGQPLPGENEPLHAYVTANNPEFVKKAVDKIKDIIRQGVEVPEGQNDLRRQQLRELALLNGTLRENDGVRCTNCGAIDHKSWLCPDKPNVTMQVICTTCGGAGHIAKDCKKKAGVNYIAADQDKAKIDQEYLSLMAELGEGPIVTNRDDTVDKSRTSSSGGLFDRSTSAPRSIMPAPVHLPTPPQLIPNTLPPPPWTPQSGKMPAPTFSLPPPVPQPSQNSQQSANPVSIIPPTWQPPVMPPQPYSFGAAGVPPVNSPLMPTWMTPPAPVAMPSNMTNAVSTQNTTSAPPVPGSTTSSSNPSLMSNSSTVSAWPTSTPLPPMPPGWQPPFPFPTAAAPTATTASPLSSFLTAPPPPPPPPPPPC